LLSISWRFGLRHWGLWMFLGIETVNGAGVQSDMAMLASRACSEASEGVGEDDVDDDECWVECVVMDRAWVPGLRATMTLFQKCL